MHPLLIGLGCALALCGCQTSETSPPAMSSSGEPEVGVHPGDAAVSVVGTPFYLVFKGVVCAAGVATAAPAASIATLSESRFAAKIRRDLGDGVNQNCGPPYVLSPYRVVLAEPTPAMPETQPPPPPEPTPGVPEVPAPPQPPEPPPNGPAAPMTDELLEPAAGGPVELFNE